jgi:hypothetical protein
MDSLKLTAAIPVNMDKSAPVENIDILYRRIVSLKILEEMEGREQ